MFKNNFGKQKEYFCNANVDPDDNAVADVEMPTLRFTNGHTFILFSLLKEKNLAVRVEKLLKQTSLHVRMVTGTMQLIRITSGYLIRIKKWDKFSLFR